MWKYLSGKSRGKSHDDENEGHYSTDKKTIFCDLMKLEFSRDLCTCVCVCEIEIRIVLLGLKMALVQYINGVSDVGEGVLRVSGKRICSEFV